MFTSISFKSESGDYCTKTFESDSVSEIIDSLKSHFGEEFEYLHITSSSTMVSPSFMREVEEAFYEAQEEI